VQCPVGCLIPYLSRASQTYSDNVRSSQKELLPPSSGMSSEPREREKEKERSPQWKTPHVTQCPLAWSAMRWFNRDQCANHYFYVLATLHTRCSFRAICSEPCLPEVTTVLQQPLLRCCGRRATKSHTNPDKCRKCTNQANGPATGLDTIAGQPDAWPSLRECWWWNPPQV
jgi:hypothetical protein